VDGGDSFERRIAFAGGLLSIAVHALLFSDLLQWQVRPPEVGNVPMSVRVALLSQTWPPSAEPLEETVPLDLPTEVEPVPRDIAGPLKPRPPETAVPAAVETPEPLPVDPKLQAAAAAAPAHARPVPPAKKPEVAKKPPLAQKPAPAKPAAKPRPRSAPKTAKKEKAPRRTVNARAASPPAAPRSAPAKSREPVVIGNPQYRRAPTPPYPRRARLLGQEGTVVVRARLNGSGKVLEIRTIRSSGYPLLDEAAAKSVAKWEFVPARRGGRSVEAWVQVPVQFVLK
jgi:protein TonB